MQNNSIIDDVVSSRTRHPGKCYICAKRTTRPFVIPVRDTVETVYRIARSVEILKFLKPFWLCDEHFDLLTKMYETDFECAEFDEMVENTYDIGVLDRWEQLHSELMNTTDIVLRYLKIQQNRCRYL